MKLRIVDTYDDGQWFETRGYKVGDIVSPIVETSAYYHLKDPINGYTPGFHKRRFEVVPEFELPKELFEI